MKQYCRYCAFCIQPDDYYCDLKGKFVSGTSENRCKDFALSDLGDADGSGRMYKPRREKTPEEIMAKQNQMRFI